MEQTKLKEIPKTLDTATASKYVLLTGVAGFIGAHTLEHFLENTDWHIVGIDSLLHHGDIRRIFQVLGKNDAWADRFDFVRYDLTKATADPLMALASELKFDLSSFRFDYIINMASESHVDRSIENPVPFIRNNVDLTITMLEWARFMQPKAFIQISTDEVYGPMFKDKPYKEWEREVPSNPYSASKAAQEMLAISYWRTYGVPLIITNTMNNIGEMQDVEKFVPNIIMRIQKGLPVIVHGKEGRHGPEFGSRYYLHARNHADALLYLLSNFPPHQYPDVERPDRYNIVGDTRLDNMQMVERIAKLMGKPYDFRIVDFHTTRPGHDPHYGLDGKKLKGLGWKPPLKFNDSLARTVQNYLDHPEWLEEME